MNCNSVLIIKEDDRLAISAKQGKGMTLTKILMYQFFLKKEKKNDGMAVACDS